MSVMTCNAYSLLIDCCPVQKREMLTFCTTMMKILDIDRNIIQRQQRANILHGIIDYISKSIDVSFE